MDVTETHKSPDRQDWRLWLAENHHRKSEIWLLYDDRESVDTVSYLESVEEAICFGWIDGLQKRINENEKAQRFTPRKKNSNWTELNKERARNLIAEGRMTEAGLGSLPDLDEEFVIPRYILEAVNENPQILANFNELPALYIRVRISYIDEMRKRPEELNKRLANFLKKTEQGKLFGNWNDGGRLGGSV